MKKGHGIFFGFAILLLAAMFTVTGCPSPTSSNDLPGIVEITGTPEVGKTLTADISFLGGSGTISYTWIRASNSANLQGATPISGAVTDTYTLGPADYGKYICVTVSRSDHEDSKTSGRAGPVKGPAKATVSTNVTITVTEAGTEEKTEAVISLTLTNGAAWKSLPSLSVDWFTESVNKLYTDESATTIDGNVLIFIYKYDGNISFPDPIVIKPSKLEEIKGYTTISGGTDSLTP
jgi:hypothetical protein